MYVSHTDDLHYQFIIPNSFIAILSLLTNCLFWQFLWNVWYQITVIDYISSNVGSVAREKCVPDDILAHAI